MAHHKPPINRNANQPNKVGFATLRAAIQRDVQRLRNDAGLHAWVGNNATNTLDNAGRLLWITLHAATRAGITADALDVRILMGMGNALGDMRERGDPLDVHRAAIQSGLLAVDRLIPYCTEMRLALAAAELDTMIQSARGLGTADLQRLLEPQ
jgi:hypothetical protein